MNAGTPEEDKAREAKSGEEKSGEEARRIDDAEYEAFARTCAQLEGFDRMLNPFHVDGWLAAMVCGPVRLAAAQWLELLCGDAFGRAFADPAAHGQALAALEARVRTLSRMLDAEALALSPDQLRLHPWFDDWSENDARDLAERLVGGFWAEGFFIGLDTLRRPWGLDERGPLDEGLDIEATMEEICAPIHALIRDPDSDEMQRHVATRHAGKLPSRDVLLDEACFAVQDLRLFLLEHGPRPAPRRVEARPGRNDPCPCGSGRKFKKCHGANE